MSKDDLCTWCIAVLVQGRNNYAGHVAIEPPPEDDGPEPLYSMKLPALLVAIKRAIHQEHSRVSIDQIRCEAPITTWHGDPICPWHLTEEMAARHDPQTVRMAQWGPRR